MHRKEYAQINSEGRCFHEFEYMGEKAPAAGAELMDVTARGDGPFIGKIYDEASDTFSDPPPPPEEEGEEGDG